MQLQKKKRNVEVGTVQKNIKEQNRAQKKKKKKRAFDIEVTWEEKRKLSTVLFKNVSFTFCDRDTMLPLFAMEFQ